MDMTAMIFSSLETDKMISIMVNTKYIYSIYVFGGFLITSVYLKILQRTAAREGKLFQKLN